MNLGIVTGSISGVCTIDLDGPEGLASARSLGLRSPLEFLTGNGRNLCYAHPGTNVTGTVRKHPGLDIRGDGNYQVLPPSVHPNGKQYRWLNKMTLKLPAFPLALQDVGTAVTKTDGEERKDPDWVKTDLERMTNGNIDDTLFRVCSYFRNLGVSREVVSLLIQPHAERAGATPGHLEDKISNVWGRYEPRVREIYDGLGESSNTRQGLILHSPTNPDSLKHYMDSKQQLDRGTELSTGFLKLDGMFQAGLKSSRVLTVAARTGTGKTNFSLAISRSLTEAGKSVLYFSTETPYTEIWDRFQPLGKGITNFTSLSFTVCDGFTPGISQVEEAIKQVSPDVFIFDHINHVAEDVKPLAEFMKGCNFLQRQYKCQGIVMAQLNRSADWVEDGKRIAPRMSMIKGAGAIEQGSSRVLLLSEERVTPEGSEIVGVLDKNDSGTKGMLNFMLKKYPHWHFEEI